MAAVGEARERDGILKIRDGQGNERPYRGDIR
jgi:hypothetical protein